MRIGRTDLWLLLAVAAGLAASTGAVAGQKTEAYAVVAGTVFREPVFALTRRRSAAAGEDPAGGRQASQAAKSGERRARRVRFPRSGRKGGIHAQRPGRGFASEQKPASVTADERVDVYFELKAVK